VLFVLTSLAAAQQVNSLLPILEVQYGLVELLEDRQFLITDMSVGMVFDGTQGHSVPVSLTRGETVLFVGVGDDERIADLDLYVFDSAGVMLADEGEADAQPILEFTAPVDGVYDVRVAVAETKEEWNGGFFTLTTAVPVGVTPISVMDTFAMLPLAVELMEAQGLQVIHGELEVLAKKDVKSVPIDVADWSYCMAVAVASENRTKKLDMAVYDPYGDLIWSDKKNKQFAFVEFAPGDGGTFDFRMNARKMRRGYTDTHAVVVVGCME
jgi:hypothetical protein